MDNEEVIESGNNLEVAEQEEVVESTTDTTEVEETEVETQEAKVETAEETVEEKTDVKQSAKDNSAARLARVRAEEKAQKEIEKARKEAYEKGIEQGKIQSFIGKKNPYTGETINDEYDVKEYQDMYELELNGKDPVKDYRELQKSRARDEAKKQLKLDEELKTKQWYEKDAKDFVDKYGQDKLGELTKDPDFDIFANGKVGKQPLTQIYEDFNKFIQKYEQKSVQTAKKLVANNTATPGKAGDGTTQTLNWDNMTPEQFEKYLERVKNGELK